MVRNPSCSGFLHSRPSLCESCSTSQILLAHSGPHPPNTMSPDPCSDFSSSFGPSDHSPPLSTPSPLSATPDPVPQTPPYVPSSLPPSEAQASATAAPNPPPQLVPEISSETSAPTSTLRVPRLYPNLPRSLPIMALNNFKTGNFTTGPCSFP